MKVSLTELQKWMGEKEREHLEFKEAKNNFHFEKLVNYCVALANEGGGQIIFGITDKIPRRVVGTTIFTDLERTKAGIIERLRLRVEASEVIHPDGRVLVFQIPSRPIGMPIQYKGTYFMRAGEELAPMTSDQLSRIFDEAEPDFSAEICPQASINDLADEAIEEFRKRWIRKSSNSSLHQLSAEQLLNDAELIVDGKVTYAALILLGSRQALGKYLPQSEVIFEYRSNEASGAAQQREEYRLGVMLFLDKLWQTLNLRNDLQHFQDGLFIYDIATFNERTVREAILNAVGHRDYRLAGSVFIRQFPRKLEVVSPGGFPAGITPENILRKQFPRNRRIAETFARCGLIERAGQGLNLMFENCIKESKPYPDFFNTDEYEVFLTIRGEVQDPEFLRILERIGTEKMSSFVTQDLLVLDLVYRGQRVPDDLRSRLLDLKEQGIIESIGRGKGTRYDLSTQFYGLLGKAGVYTRKRGLDRETNKALLLKHLENANDEGSPLGELIQVIPFLSRREVQNLLQELKMDGRVDNRGRTRAGRWYLSYRLDVCQKFIKIL